MHNNHSKWFVIHVFFLLVFGIQTSRAHEGMWIPLLIQQQIFPEMQKAGCKLTAEQIYSAKQISLKDAVVRIGNGCSGGFISKQGLIITNHHCIQYYITQISTTQKNYLTQGFWAQSQSEEIPAKGLHVERLVDIEDVTSIIKQHTPANASLQQIKAVVDSIQKVLQAESKNIISIESFYSGNQFFKFTSIKYSDIRFVGFPSEQAGSFGGNTDNWAWPRHSADFAVLRVYVDSLQNPSVHADSNVPHTPINYFRINKNGVKENDYTMVLGFPGETNSYASSQEIQLLYDSINPKRIAIKEMRLNPINEYMQTSDSAYLQYYSTYSSHSNSLIKWKGEQYGLRTFKAIEKRREKEKNIEYKFANNDSLLQKYRAVYSQYESTSKDFSLMYGNILVYIEGLWRTEFFKNIEPIFALYKSSSNQYIDSVLSQLIKRYNNYFKKTELSIEKQSIPEICEYIISHFPNSEFSKFILTQKDRPLFYTQLLESSFLSSRKKNEAFLRELSRSKYANNSKKLFEFLSSDKAIETALVLYRTIYQDIYMDYVSAMEKYEQAEYEYMAFMLSQSLVTYPNANGTFRVSFGNVMPYKPADGVYYESISKTNGILEKLMLGNSEYKTDSTLLALITSKQFGKHGEEYVPTNFIANNQTTGGNSGSPVLDAYGRLIGVNFDRTKESTMSDVNYNPEVCRNISVDIRFILFMIDVYGGSRLILNELDFN